MERTPPTRRGSCRVHLDALVLEVVSGTGTTAIWSWQIPNSPQLFGAVFYNQAFPLDPRANAFGFTASDGAAGHLGY